MPLSFFSIEKIKYVKKRRPEPISGTSCFYQRENGDISEGRWSRDFWSQPSHWWPSAEYGWDRRRLCNWIDPDNYVVFGGLNNCFPLSPPLQRSQDSSKWVPQDHESGWIMKTQGQLNDKHQNSWQQFNVCFECQKKCLSFTIHAVYLIPSTR